MNKTLLSSLSYLLIYLSVKYVTEALHTNEHYIVTPIACCITSSWIKMKTYWQKNVDIPKIWESPKWVPDHDHLSISFLVEPFCLAEPKKSSTRKLQKELTIGNVVQKYEEVPRGDLYKKGLTVFHWLYRKQVHLLHSITADSQTYWLPFFPYKN